MKQIRYENMDKAAATNTFQELLQWRKERRAKKKDLSFKVPQAKNKEIDFLAENRDTPTITWIGHSTFLLQLNGKNIVTDPVWARQMGTDRRLTDPGLPIHSLPSIDIVLISHSHYDHLHSGSIKRLPGNPTFFVPVGLGRWFKRRGFNKVIECNWWDETKLDGINITFVPAQHWTKRTLTDTNRSHWGGWVLRAVDSPTVYFAGDSGYCTAFKEIGSRFSIDYCLMPIGAYEPEWFMATQHVSPEEAVKAFLDTKAKTMIPMHYGAFRLADDTPKEALDRLQAAWKKENLTEERLRILALGETWRQ